MKKIFWLLVFSLVLTELFGVGKLPSIAMSAVLPGSGEIYMGKTQRGIAIVAWDVLSIAAFLNTGTQVEKIEKSYKQLAYTYAGVPLDRPDQYYQRIQDYISSAEFNTIQEMQARNFFLIYNYDPQAFEEYIIANTYSGDMTWQWDTTANWLQYRELRADYRKTKMNYNLLMGVLILNRVVSVIDVAIINPSQSSQIGSVSFSPIAKNGLMFNYTIDF